LDARVLSLPKLLGFVNPTSPLEPARTLEHLVHCCAVMLVSGDHPGGGLFDGRRKVPLRLKKYVRAEPGEVLRPGVHIQRSRRRVGTNAR